MTKAATCTATGTRKYTCSKCSGSYTENIAATGHSYTSKVTAPTCTAQGYTTYTCSKCSNSYKDNYTAATGHNWSSGKCTKCSTTCSHSWGSGTVTKAATCTATGTRTYTCSTCKHTKTETIAATGHSYTSKVTAPTCTSGGYTTYTCTNCGNSYTGNNTSATGHSYTSKVTTAATCTTAGVKTYTCSKCSDSYTESIPATGHSYSSKVTAPTCTAGGYTTYTCAGCGDSYTGNPTAATGHSYVNGICQNCGDGCDHSWNSGVVTKAATCTAEGVKTYTCSACNATKTEAIAASGHSYSSKVTAPTCAAGGYTIHICGTCGDSYTDNETAAVGHNYSAGTCTVCGNELGLYLFGYINGGNYACEEDAENIGIYQFVDGALTVTFNSDSYVAVKTGDNYHWYMTNGYPGDDAVSATLYNNSIGIDANKLRVPGGVEVTFTVTANTADDTLILSYTANTDTCTHLNHGTDGCCKVCGTAVAHSYVGDTCTGCGLVRDYYLYGFINGADYAYGDDGANVGEFKFENGQLIVTFTEESYVAVKTGDNLTWYMSEGYDPTATTVTLYNTQIGLNVPEKLRVPGGVEVIFTLTVNGENDTLTLSYTINSETCVHLNHGTDGVCTICGATVGHSYEDGACTVCGLTRSYYLFGYINGGNYACEEDADNIGIYQFVNGKLTVTFDSDSYVAVKTGDNMTWYMTNGYPGDYVSSATLYDTSVGIDANKIHVPGGMEVVLTLVVNTDGTLTLSYEVPNCTHAYKSKVTTEGNCTTDTVTTFTCPICGDSYTETTTAPGHSYEASVTAPTCTAGGYTTYTCSACGDSYIGDGTEATGHNYVDGVCQNCGDGCTHNWADGICTGCHKICEHSYVGDTCSICGKVRSYYLFGYINGGNYACEEDGENIGIYKFVDGKLTVTFDGDSYVAVKTGDNLNWYMTNGYPGDDATSATLYNTGSGIDANKLRIPGGVEVIFTLTLGADDTLTLSYELNKAQCTHPSHGTDGLCTICGVAVDHSFDGDTCTGCGLTCQHSYTDGVCGICGSTCGHSYVDGVCGTCGVVCGHENHNTNGLCTACGAVVNHSYTDGICTGCGRSEETPATITIYFDNSQKGWENVYIYAWTEAGGKSTEYAGTWPGITMTLVGENLYAIEVSVDAVNLIFSDGGANQTENLTAPAYDSGLNLYTADGWTTYEVPCDHSWENGVCTLCEAVCSHETHDADGICGTCGSTVKHSYADSTCTICGKVCSHNYTDGICTDCGLGCEHTYEDGTCTNCGFVCAHGEHDMDGICALCGGSVQHTYEDSTCTVCGAVCQHSHYTNGACVDCGKACAHSYADGACTICGAADPALTQGDYYLFGWINGGNYACEENGSDLGIYKFVGGKLTVTFDINSYVGVKTGDNLNWYMTDGYLGENVITAILYNTNSGINADKFYIPGGVEVTLTLLDNGDGTLTLSYSGDLCDHPGHGTDGLCTACGQYLGHSWSNGRCTACGVSCSHNWYDGTCTSCGKVCSHSWSNGQCTICGCWCWHNFSGATCTYCGYTKTYYLFGYINGGNYACEEDGGNLGSYKFVNGRLTVKFTQNSYVGVKTGDNGSWYMTDGYLGESTTSATLYNTNSGIDANKLYVPGGVYVTFYLTVNSNDTVTLRYVADVCYHSYHNTNGMCTGCGIYVGHKFSGATCSVCRLTRSYYLFGYINGSNYACEEDGGNLGIYKFVNGKLTVTFAQNSYVGVKTNDNGSWYMTDGYLGNVTSATLYNTNAGINADKFFIPGGVEVTIYLTVNTNDTVSIRYTADICEHPSHDTSGICTECGESVGHSYSGSTCTVCGETKAYYLFGDINGSNYACEENGSNLGIYKFVDGKLTVTFEANSYVGIKTGDNSSWYMTDGYLGENVTTATLYNTNSGINADKFYIPGGVEVTLTMVDNGNDTLTLTVDIQQNAGSGGDGEEILCEHPDHDVLGNCTECGQAVTHSYESGICTVCGRYAIKLEYPALAFEDEIRYNIYYSVDPNGVQPEEMDLILFSERLIDGTIENAEQVIGEYSTTGSLYIVRTGGIPAKKLGDMIYFKVYAKLEDGTYLYSDVAGYSAVLFAKSILASEGDEELHKLMVAMLNYGAAAQQHFGYRTDDLMNAFLTDEQKALVGSFTADMVDPLLRVDSTKAGDFIYQAEAFGAMYPAVVFEGAFKINYYFQTVYELDGDMTLYYWTLTDFNKLDVLTMDNATGSAIMQNVEGSSIYTAAVEGIAAKRVNQPVFVVGVYESEGVQYCTGVIPYSLGAFCSQLAAKGSETAKALAEATAVYGDCAKQYFRVIPVGDRYVLADGTELLPGDSMPKTVSDGDEYITNGYTYKYGYIWDKVVNEEGETIYQWVDTELEGWSVMISDNTLTWYPELLGRINRMPLLSLRYTFSGCTGLVTAPIIPEGVTDLSYAFCGCTALVTAPEIPASVTNMNSTFSGCTALEGEIIIDAVLAEPVCAEECDCPGHTEENGCEGCAECSTYVDCFSGTVNAITITGGGNMLAELAATAETGNVMVIEQDVTEEENPEEEETGDENQETTTEIEK